ncbi:MAG: undecaprenyl-diphosphate phosphatase [Thermaerobacter sp.]|nr:undecaprenyl-diphosphate phosphatase [Thermaerobacter sp.]
MPLAAAALLGILQGVTELFPFSSLGLLVILPHVVPIPTPTSGARYLPFLVALHAGTALALFLLFNREWSRIIRGFFAWLRGKRTMDGRMAWLLVWGTIPAGLAGLVFKHPLESLFANPLAASIFLIINGMLMLIGDRVQKRTRRSRTLPSLTSGDALIIGVFQILALLPGMSRSGATMTGGVSRGLNFGDAAHFSFLLATPIILAAAVLELPKLHGGLHGMLLPSLLGGVAAGITAWLSARFLLRYFRHHSFFRLAIISIGLGTASLIVIH